jgi:anti-anti-sigma factor
MACDFLIVQRYDNLVLAKVTKDRLLDPASITALADALLAEVNRAAMRPSLVLDLSDVSYLSSAMIGKLVAVLKAVKGSKGRMALSGVKATIMPLFKVTQLDKLFDFADDAEQLLLAYRRKPL